MTQKELPPAQFLIFPAFATALLYITAPAEALAGSRVRVFPGL